MREIDNTTAVTFLHEVRANKEHISITDADMWLGCYEYGSLVGVIAMNTGKTERIKAFWVKPEARHHGIGTALLQEMLKRSTASRITAFATDKSVNIFEKEGFKRMSQNKNGIWFMERR